MAVVLIVVTLSGFYANLANHLERNVLLVERLSLLMDRSFVEDAKLRIALDATSENHQEKLGRACTDKKQDAQACARALMAAVDDGMQLSKLVEHLSTLSEYPDARNIVASYTGEIWFRAGRVNDAITVWRVARLAGSIPED